MSKAILDEVLRRLEDLPPELLTKKHMDTECKRSWDECSLCDLIDDLAGIVNWARLEEERQRLIFGEAA